MGFRPSNIIIMENDMEDMVEEKMDDIHQAGLQLEICNSDFMF